MIGLMADYNEKNEVKIEKKCFFQDKENFILFFHRKNKSFPINMDQ